MDLTTHERKIFVLWDRLKRREEERASDTGEDRESIGSVLELTGLHSMAHAFVRRLDKMPEDKRNDVLRSLDPLLELAAGRWNGTSTPDMIDALSERERANVEAGRHASDDGITDEDVDALAGEFDDALDGLEEDDAPAEDGEADAPEEEATSNVVPWDADAA
jgi:hypothetical protein